MKRSFGAISRPCLDNRSLSEAVNRIELLSLPLSLSGASAVSATYAGMTTFDVRRVC